MRSIYILALSILLSGCVSQQQRTVNDPSVQLFNGRDLTGWSVRCKEKDKGKIFWTVQDGAIVCDSIGRKDHDYVWLVSDDEFDDFELKLKFRVFRDCPGNSGVQFRSRYDQSANGGWLDGPQVDIHAPADMPWRTGLIYDETREEKRWVYPSLKNWSMDPAFKPKKFILKYSDEQDGWNELTLICRGMHIRTIVNGIVRTDWDATGILDNAAHHAHNVGTRGHIALQLHSGDELKIHYRDITVKRL